MKFKIELKGMADLVKELERQKEKKVPVKKEVLATALDIRNQAIANCIALGVKDLAGSGGIIGTIIVETKADGLQAEIGPTAPYGHYVEFGTRPHFPPPEALEGWAKRHGFKSTWPICEAIARRGLPARPYLSPAFFSQEGEFYDRLKRIMEK